ncbi:MAG: DUF1957 domain-containing protein [Firmicutes bacterium]|nr:DUF1957 domain-containing protein [Bacillota bacterium]
MPAASVCLILHAHLPWVFHPDQPHAIEQRWLPECLLESYLPLLMMLEKLAQEGVPYHLAFSISPSLLSMWENAVLMDHFARYMDNLEALCQQEIARASWNRQRLSLLRDYQDRFAAVRRYFERYGRRPAAALKQLIQSGHIELMTTSATHAFLPLLAEDQQAVYLQIHAGIAYVRRKLELDPQGFWLPECGYFPGVDHFLKTEGIRYLITDTHGLLYAEPRPRYGPFAPVILPASGIAAFARDPNASREVWSATEGYPGAPFYREFYADAADELDEPTLRRFVHPEGLRVQTGLKYYRITGQTHAKEPYDPALARAQAKADAYDFVSKREQESAFLAHRFDRPPALIAPFDAELFGHWWYEGPQWLEEVLRLLARRETLQASTPGDILREQDRLQPTFPAPTSWGEGGYFDLWINPKTSWLVPALHRASQQMQAHQSKLAPPLFEAAMRELFLAQASDWPFIIATQSNAAYAQKRIHTHLDRLTAILEGKVREERLQQWMQEDAVLF